MTDLTLTTRNLDWGFYGTSAGFTDAGDAWAKALAAVGKATGAARTPFPLFLALVTLAKGGRYAALAVALA